MREGWRPFTLPWNDSPIDISFVFEGERPAGKHGFLTTQGPQFVFQDGTVARFWGTCFNSGANFPTHSYSEMVAERLAKYGLNMMRTHQMDSEWATPNIFQFNRARPKDNTCTFDPESIDRLDYLFYCLKQAGVYVYLDLLTYRQFRPGDDVDAVSQLPQAAKPYHYFDPRLVALQKQFNRDLWTHANPYTKLAYKDDPVIALCELVNESDFFAQPPVLEPYRTRLEAMYRAWCDRQSLSVPAEKVDFTKPNQQVARFFIQVMRDYYRELTADLRKIGVRIPIAGTNWSINLGVHDAQAVTDFNDSHVYWNFPTWESPNGTHCRPMVSEYENTFHTLSMERALGKPFFVSEWDHAWPDPYRAESSLAYAAVAALQGWGGLTIHTYRYSTHSPWDRLGATTINGITYRNHFDSFNDPAKFGLFPAAALLFRRGDLKPAEKAVAVSVPESMPDYLLKRPQDIAALSVVSELHRVGVVLPDAPAQADVTVTPEQRLVQPEAGEVLADTGEMWRSWAKGWGWIDTPRTKVVYGALAKAGHVALKGLSLEAQNAFGTVALSSLTDEATETSDTLLLSAIGNADNTDAKYSEDGTRMLDFGHAPVLIEPITATVEIKTTHPHLKVWVIADNKEAVTPLKTEYKDGILSFEIGPQPTYNPSTMYYLIKI